MSHTYTAKGGTVFHYSPDLSGAVMVTTKFGTGPGATEIRRAFSGPALQEFMRERDGGERDRALAADEAEEAEEEASEPAREPAHDSWLGRRVRVTGTDFEGVVTAHIDFPGEPDYVRVIRPAEGRVIPSSEERFIRGAHQYLPEASILGPGPLDVPAMQAVIAQLVGGVIPLETPTGPQARASADAGPDWTPPEGSSPKEVRFSDPEEWFGRRVRVRGTDFVGTVEGTVEGTGLGISFKVMRRAAGRSLLGVVGPHVLTAIEYVPYSREELPADQALVQSVTAYESGLELDRPCPDCGAESHQMHTAECPQCPSTAACDRACEELPALHGLDGLKDIARSHADELLAQAEANAHEAGRLEEAARMRTYLETRIEDRDTGEARSTAKNQLVTAAAHRAEAHAYREVLTQLPKAPR